MDRLPIKNDKIPFNDLIPAIVKFPKLMFGIDMFLTAFGAAVLGGVIFWGIVYPLLFHP